MGTDDVRGGVCNGWELMMSAVGGDWVYGRRNSKNRSLTRRRGQLFENSVMTVIVRLFRENSRTR